MASNDPFHVGLVVTILLAIASIVSGCSYALCESVEKQIRNRHGEVVLSLLATGLFAISLIPLLMLASYILLTDPPLLFLYPITLGSAWLHQKLGGTSKNYSTALTVMLCTTVISFVGGATLQSILILATVSWLQVSFSWTRDDSTFVYVCALYGYSQIAPIAAWVWRGFKPRPGVEVHLKSGKTPG